jgi:transcription elongation factor Elf1
MKATNSRKGIHQSKGCWIRKERRLAIYIRDNFTCCYCNRDLHNETSDQITLDHLIARSEHIDNTSTNLITACKSCNSRRQNQPFYLFASAEALVKIESLRYADLNMKLATDIIRGFVEKEKAYK